jgi:hypothetical protein
LQFPEIEQPAPAKPPSSAAQANGNGVADPTVMHKVMAAILESCLCAAIDAAREAQTYASAHGFPLTFGPGEVQDMAISLYIQRFKESNIAQMHQNAQLRANGGANPWQH